MILRRVFVSVLVGALALAPSLSAARQGRGLISGRADDEAATPYSNYTVRLRNVASGHIVGTRPLHHEARFSFEDVALNQRYLVELFHVKQERVVCTEGPFGLVAGEVVSKTDVNIDCGVPPALLWLLGASTGTAALLGATQASSSR